MRMRKVDDRVYKIYINEGISSTSTEESMADGYETGCGLAGAASGVERKRLNRRSQRKQRNANSGWTSDHRGIRGRHTEKGEVRQVGAVQRICPAFVPLCSLRELLFKVFIIRRGRRPSAPWVVCCVIGRTRYGFHTGERKVPPMESGDRPGNQNQFRAFGGASAVQDWGNQRLTTRLISSAIGGRFSAHPTLGREARGIEA